MVEEVKNIVVIGAGLMGNGIAQISLMAGYNVVMVDIKQEFVDKGVSAIENGLKRLEAKGQLNAADLMGRLKSSTDLASAVKDADFIIWSHHPLSTQAVCEQTWIEGRKYFDLTEDLEMRKQVIAERARLIQKVLTKEKSPVSGKQ